MGILKDKVAIVTGAGRGLGVSEALALAREGASIVVVSRTMEEVRKTASKIEAIGVRALGLTCDVRNADEVQAAVAGTIEHFGRVDILVNNAQILYNAHPFESWTDGEMRATWESGVLGSFYFMNACFPHMKQCGGRIINLCAPSGHGHIAGFLGYSMAKEAIRSLTRCAAREWGKYEITVNSLSPIAMSAAGELYFDTEEKRNELFDMLGSAIRRFGNPEKDVGRAVVFLAGPDSGFVTGCTLGVDGGSAML